MLQAALKRSAAATGSRMASPAMGATRGMAKEIKFSVEGRAAMLKGVDLLADAVQVRSIFCALPLYLTRHERESWSLSLN
jgi:hypothetical protein